MTALVGPALAPARSVDRLLLAAAHRLEALAVARIRRRAARIPMMRAHDAAAEQARDRGCAVHQGLLPR